MPITYARWVLCGEIQLWRVSRTSSNIYQEKNAVKTFLKIKKSPKESVRTWTKLVMVVCWWRQRAWCDVYMTTVTSRVWYRCAVNSPSGKNAAKLKTREKTFVKTPPSASVSYFEVSFRIFTEIRRFHLSVHRWTIFFLSELWNFATLLLFIGEISCKQAEFAHITIFRLHLVIVINWFDRAKYLFIWWKQKQLDGQTVIICTNCKREMWKQFITNFNNTQGIFVWIFFSSFVEFWTNITLCGEFWE